MGLRLAVDMGVFDAANRLREQDKPVSLASLATETGVEELLLRMSISQWLLHALLLLTASTICRADYADAHRHGHV